VPRKPDPGAGRFLHHVHGRRPGSGGA
jgi:hypothetical protein